MPDVAPFAVDLDQVHDTIDTLDHNAQGFDELLDRLQARVTGLHGTWSGLAAAAHHEAHAEWTAGFATMRQALGQMRGAAQVAHDNYADAATTNLRMWEQVR